MTYGTLPVPTYTGYRFERWVDEYGRTVNATTIVNIPKDHTLIAVWVPEDSMPFTVKHMLQNISDNGYTLFDEETRYGQTDTVTAVEANSYEGFTAKTVAQVNINGDGSAVVEIYYDRNIHTITWNIKSEIQTQSYRFGQVIDVPVATCAGYTFVGWDMTPPATMPDRSLTITAQWKEASYTVTLNGNGGTDAGTVTVTYNSEYPVLPDSSRTGYTFAGWFTEAENGTQIRQGDAVTITQNSTLYAHWTANSYNVSFDLNGATGTAPGSITVTYDGTYEGLPEGTGTKAGYHFNGWYTAPGGGEMITTGTVVKITAPVTLYARWAPNTYTVIFDANGGNGVMDSQNHTYDMSLALPEVKFNKDGHTFTGWNTKEDGTGKNYANMQNVTNLTEINGEIVTLYAQWSINSYTVTFDSVGGTYVEPVTQIYNTYVGKPVDPTKQGYSFAGWLNGEIEVTLPIKLTDNLNLTAKWNLVEYTITYVGVEGIENNNPASYTFESNAITLEDPGSRTGYTFSGWYTSGDFSEESKVDGVAINAGSTGVKTFYANWTPNTYIVRFDDGTKSNNTSMTAQIFTYDVSQPLRSNEYNNEGYTFIGWGLEPESEVVYEDGDIIRNLVPFGSITLYAQWKPITYTISYTLGSGATNVDNPTSYDIETPDISLKSPSGIKPGYQFLGWYNGSTKVTSVPKGSTGNIPLTAKWAHGGIFTLAKTGEKVNGTTKDITFTVTRELPAGTIATTDIQYVYYRTVNGTAIGGTAAPIHFTHVGGDDTFLTFGQSDTSKTFDVKQESFIAGSGEVVNSFTDGVDRYYNVELYKIASPDGNCTGVMGSVTRVTRTLTQGAQYKISSSLYSDEYSMDIQPNGNYFTVYTKKNYDQNIQLTFTAGYSQLGITQQQNNYITNSGSEYALRITMDVKEEEDGYQFISVHRNSDNKQLAEWEIELKRGEVASNWGRNLKLPITGNQGDIMLYKTIVNNMVGYSEGGTDYFKFTLGDSFTLKFNAEGKGNNDWNVGRTQAYMKIVDKTEPAVIGIAPMALGTYKKDDEFFIAVRFNEIVATASNVTMSKISKIPVNSWSYVGGAGTNVLVFKGTLTEDFKVDTNKQTELVSTKPTVNGTIRDLAN